MNSGNILFDNLVSDEISVQEKIKIRLKSRNNCCHLVLNPLSYILLSKNVKIKIYRTIIFLLFGTGVKLGRSHWRRNVG